MLLVECSSRRFTLRGSHCLPLTGNDNLRYFSPSSLRRYHIMRVSYCQRRACSHFSRSLVLGARAPAEASSIKCLARPETVIVTVAEHAENPCERSARPPRECNCYCGGSGEGSRQVCAFECVSKLDIFYGKRDDIRRQPYRPIILTKYNSCASSHLRNSIQMRKGSRHR